MSDPAHNSANGEHGAPTDWVAEHFDWDLLERALGESCPDMEGPDFALLGHALRVVMRWLTAGRRDHRPGPPRAQQIGRKALVLAWVVDPGIIEGSPALRHLAAQLRISRSMLAKLSVRAGQFVGTKTDPHSHARTWTRPDPFGARDRMRALAKRPRSPVYSQAAKIWEAAPEMTAREVWRETLASLGLPESFVTFESFRRRVRIWKRGRDVVR